MTRPWPRCCAPWLLAVLLAACGGGDPPSQAAGAQRAAEQLRLRARALSAASVAPAEAARQLMDFAQAQYPQYFPSAQPTQSLPPFVYRHYPQTGVYLGVVITAGMGYEHLGVYVMGGPFGNAPTLVGPLSAFITPVDPGGGPGPSGSSNGCHDLLLSIEGVPGTRLVMVRRFESSNGMGMHGVTQTIDLTVRGPRAYEGHDAVEALQRMVDSGFAGGIPDGTPGASDILVYSRKTGPAEVTFFGTVALPFTTTQSVGGITVTGTGSGRSVTVPPLVRKEYAIPLGGSATMATTYHDQSVSTTTIGNQAPVTRETSSQYAVTETMRFLRREKVTVPAGSFDACVFESTTVEEPGVVSTTWVADGKGFDLKQVIVAGGVTTTMQALSIRLNGQPVTP